MNEQSLLEEHRVHFNEFFEDHSTKSDVIQLWSAISDEIEKNKKILQSCNENYYLLKTVIYYYNGTFYNELSNLADSYYAIAKLKAKSIKGIFIDDEKDILEITSRNVERFNHDKIKLVLKSNDWYKKALDLINNHYQEENVEWITIKNHLLVNYQMNLIMISPLSVVLEIDYLDNNLDLYSYCHETIVLYAAINEFVKFNNNGLFPSLVKMIDKKCNARVQKTLSYICNIYKSGNEIEMIEVRHIYDDFINSLISVAKEGGITNLPNSVIHFEEMYNFYSILQSNNSLLDDHTDDIIRTIIDNNLEVSKNNELIYFTGIIEELQFLLFDYEFYGGNRYMNDYLVANLFNFFDKISFALFKYIEGKNTDIRLEENKYDFQHMMTIGIGFLKKISEPDFRSLTLYMNVIGVFNENIYLPYLKTIKDYRNEITHKPILFNDSYSRSVKQDIKKLQIYVIVFLVLSIRAIQINSKTT